MPKCSVCGKRIPLLEVDLTGSKQICKKCIRERSETEKESRLALKKEENEHRLALKKEENEHRLALKKKETEDYERAKEIPFVTTDSFATTKTIKTLGTARGSTVRAKHIGRDFMAEVKNIVGGEIKGYTELLAEGREEAIIRMKLDAIRIGANAIVCVRFASSNIGAGVAEILAYGTAVTINRE